MSNIELESQKAEQIVETLVSNASYVEGINIPGRGRLYLLHNPEGIETKHLLDANHMPRITKFTDMVISDIFAPLREEDDDITTPVNIVPTDPDLLKIISTIANLPRGIAYDPEKGRGLRKVDLEAMSEAMRDLYELCPVDDAIIVPVKRCGENIAREIGIHGLPSEAKRLRFNGDPNILGAGGNFDFAYLQQFSGKDVRLCEGIGAAGSTEILYMSALCNWGVDVKSLAGDFVVSCPSGARLVEEVRNAFRINGRDNACFSVGILNQDWYVIYKNGEQVMGDGGDLTSNID